MAYVDTATGLNGKVVLDTPEEAIEATELALSLTRDYLTPILERQGSMTGLDTRLAASYARQIHRLLVGIEQYANCG